MKTLNIEGIAKQIAISVEDSNCPNPAGHWDGSGQMPIYSEEKKEKFRTIARTVISLLENLKEASSKEHWTLPALAVAIHSASNLCGSEGPQDAIYPDFECIDAAMAVYALTQGDKLND